MKITFPYDKRKIVSTWPIDYKYFHRALEIVCFHDLTRVKEKSLLTRNCYLNTLIIQKNADPTSSSTLIITINSIHWSKNTSDMGLSVLSTQHTEQHRFHDHNIGIFQMRGIIACSSNHIHLSQRELLEAGKSLRPPVSVCSSAWAWGITGFFPVCLYHPRWIAFPDMETHANTAQESHHSLKTFISQTSTKNTHPPPTSFSYSRVTVMNRPGCVEGGGQTPS